MKINYDKIIESINNNKLNINELDYETKMKVMKISLEKTFKKKSNRKNKKERQLELFEE